MDNCIDQSFKRIVFSNRSKMKNCLNNKDIKIICIIMHLYNAEKNNQFYVKYTW